MYKMFIDKIDSMDKNEIREFSQLWHFNKKEIDVDEFQEGLDKVDARVLKLNNEVSIIAEESELVAGEVKGFE